VLEGHFEQLQSLCRGLEVDTGDEAYTAVVKEWRPFMFDAYDPELIDSQAVRCGYASLTSWKARLAIGC